MISTAIIIPFCDNRRPLQDRILLTVATVAVFHIMAACYDQFVPNVVFWEGERHQVSRDVGFMLCDLLNLAITVGLLRIPRVSRDLSRDEIILAALAVFLLFVLSLIM